LDKRKKQKCPYCGEKFKWQGFAPHKARCAEKHGGKKAAEAEEAQAAAVKVPARPQIWEKHEDGLYHCKWCNTTSSRAQGIAVHATKRHAEQYRQFKASKGYGPAHRVAGAIKTVSKARGRIQKKECGFDLTAIPLEKLPVLINHARTEIDARCKDLLASC